MPTKEQVGKMAAVRMQYRLGSDDRPLGPRRRRVGDFTGRKISVKTNKSNRPAKMKALPKKG